MAADPSRLAPSSASAVGPAPTSPESVDAATALARAVAQQATLFERQQHLLEALASRSAPRSGPKVHIQPPTKFDGAAQAGAVDAWLLELATHFAYYGMATDVERITFAAAHLAPGSAPQGWWHSLGANKPTSWHDFERQLRAEFQPVQAADAARVRLDSLHQGRSQATTDYVAEFRRLMILVPDMAAADRRHRFVSGLRPSLAKLVLAQAPDTVEKAIELAVRLDGHAALLLPHSNSGNVHRDSASPMDLSHVEAQSDLSTGSLDTATPQIVQLLASMQAQLSAMQSRNGGFRRGPRGDRVQGVSAELIRERLRRGECLVCGSKSHMKAECPQRSSSGPLVSSSSATSRGSSSGKA